MNALPSNTYDRLTYGLLSLFGLLILWIFRDYGMSWDAPYHDDCGQLVIGYYKAWLQGQPFDMSQFDPVIQSPIRENSLYTSNRLSDISNRDYGLSASL